MEKKIIALIAEMLGKDEASVSLKSNFVTDLNADSLDILEMLLRLEEEFQVSIKDEDVSTIKTVQDLVNYIKTNK
jgi:acyl carrier protein